MRRLSFIAVAMCLAVIFTSCGNNIPEINQIESRINFRMDSESGTADAELMVFLSADDEDGEEDLETLFVMNDENEIFWTAGRDKWISRSSRGMEWIGAEKLRMHDGSIPPYGTYRVLIVDRAGERASESFFIPLIKELPEEEMYPRIIFGEGPGLFRVDSPSQSNIISFHDSGGQLIGTFSVTPGNIQIERLENGNKIAADYRYITVGTYNNTIGAGLITGPYRKN
jgi:hypothetical protein